MNTRLRAVRTDELADPKLERIEPSRPSVFGNNRDLFSRKSPFPTIQIERS